MVIYLLKPKCKFLNLLIIWSKTIGTKYDCAPMSFILYSPVVSGRTLRFQSACVAGNACFHFCRAMLCISAAYAVMQCLSVCVSVTFVDHVKTNKHIFKIFSPLGSQAILVFVYQTSWHYTDGNPFNGGI